MKRKVLLTFAMLSVAIIGMSQTSEEFKPSGKFFGGVFTNFYTTFSDGESASGFQLNRLELGYQYKFSEKFSAKACIDVDNPKDGGSLDYTAFARNAYVEYADKGLTIDFGLITANAFNLQENFWGYRYIEKAFQDLYKYSASRDLGVKAAYKFNDIISADVIVVNGEGYKKLQRDSTVRIGAGATITPVKQLTLRAYYDIIDKEETQGTMALFAGYKVEKFSLGFEYNQMTNTSFEAGADQDGISAYATYNPSKKVKVFGRYDHRASDSDWNLSNDGDLILAGFEYAPVKGLKFAPNINIWNPADDSPTETTFYLSCQIKF